MTNILFFMTDQQHADCLSYMGHPLVKTPNLDRLATRSCLFRQMYTCSAICSPSRTSFLTGMYLRAHGHVYNDGDLRLPVPTLPHVLRQQGYTTFQCGKSHVPPAVASGFDRMRTLTQFKADRAAAGIDEQPPDVKANRELVSRQFDSYRSAAPESWSSEVWTSQRAIEFLQSEQAKARPWFMWCSFERPHSPHSPPAAFDDLYRPEDIPIDWESYERFENSRIGNRPYVEEFWKIGSSRDDLTRFQKAVCRYFAMITLIDREVGRVLDTLAARGLAENTIIVFTSDHGDWAGHYGMLGKNLPGYDHLLRVPFIYVDPQRPEHAGRVIEGMYQSVDLMPTLLERLGFDVPPTVQGVNLLPAMEGHPGSTREFIFAETSMVKTIRSREWKLNFYVCHPGRGQLFRMGHKPDELTNLWNDPTLQDMKMELLQQLTAWMAGSEQPDSMSPRSEVYVDTRWYRWLSQQPRRCAIPVGPTD